MSTPPIADPDQLDVVGVRRDGGLDMVISCSGRIDDSPRTREMLRAKVGNYLNAAADPKLREHYKVHADAPVRIVILHDGLDPRCETELAELRVIAAKAGISLVATTRT